jgi:Bacterial alpha-L-rhamnosidase 6 hairpin glycosidase domain/Alpha-L-rhamnosidase N-terminal domain/Bacterial alpha-L-rhamnosidase C-terminal domain/Bacterial alpha-L-rhamnosidase concanavalin-like domain
MFRRRFDLATVPTEAPSRITADSRYVLWVNGHELGRGPARSQPYRQRYDSYDLAPYLSVGANVVAVLVTYYGRAMSFWQPAPAGSNTDAALVFEVKLGERTLVSDDSWRVQRSDAWSLLAGTHAGEGVPVEIVDAREVPRGWHDVDFDDSNWRQAPLLPAIHPASLGETRPPTYPFGRMLPRGISQLVGDRVGPARILDSSTRTAPTWRDDHPATRVNQALLAGIVGAQAAELPSSFDLAPGQVHHFSVDFGRIVAGFVELDLEAPAGTVVEMHYREKVFRPELAWSGEDPETGARYLAAGTDDQFAALEINGLRYLHLVVHADQPVSVTLKRLEVREYLYPRTGRAYFRSDDPQLDRHYQAGIRTVQLNSLDSYTDCPTREQRAWVGDAVVHQMVDLATNEDWGLARNYLELSDSPRPDGILPMVVASDIEASGGLTIPDWSLSWIHGLHIQYWHDGDLETVRRHLPTAERVLRWYTSYVDERGTIADVPEWNLVDWASIFVSGRSSILTALWARGLAEFAELADAIGNAGSAAWARKLYDSAAQGYEEFWDADRGLYVDHVLEGQRRPAASQVAQASAVISGLAPRDRWSPLVDAMTDSDRLVIPSWVGSETGGYDHQRFAEQMRGTPRIDWDPEREMVIAEPFFSYAVHDAVARAGRAELLVDLVRRWEEFLVDGYDTFGECWGWGTPVHGWSSTPTRDLVWYVLGVTPAEPGYRRVRVAPRLGRLRECAGAVPTPHGLIEVRVSGSDAEIDSPVPIVVVHEDRTETELAAGQARATIR